MSTVGNNRRPQGALERLIEEGEAHDQKVRSRIKQVIVALLVVMAGAGFAWWNMGQSKAQLAAANREAADMVRHARDALDRGDREAAKARLHTSILLADSAAARLLFRDVTDPVTFPVSAVLPEDGSAQGLLVSRDWVRTHRGWTLLTGEPVPAPAPPLNVKRFAEYDIDICAIDYEGHMRVGRVDKQRLIADGPFTEIVAHSLGCAGLHADGKAATIVAQGAGAREILGVVKLGVSAVGELLVAREGEVAVWHASKPLSWQAVEGRPTALQWINQQWWVGTADGRVRVHSPIPAVDRDPQAPISTLPLHSNSVTSAVVMIEQGPLDSVLVGFASGRVELWSASGYLLRQVQLQGAPLDAMLSPTRANPDRWWLVSTRGQVTFLPLPEFELPWCEFANLVSQQVKTVWLNGEISVPTESLLRDCPARRKKRV